VDDRKTFLMEMYRQMFADINRQMTVVWQAVSVLGSGPIDVRGSI